MRDFQQWRQTFTDGVATYRYYVDFDKVYKNVDEIKVELNILNSLIGSADIETDFERLLTKYPQMAKCIPILLAVRMTEIAVLDERGDKRVYNFRESGDEIDNYKTFMRETGLFDLLQKHLISNVVDYVTGVEVGLDSNGRKNRTGHLMEDLVEEYIRRAGFVRGENYFKEMYSYEIEERWGIDLATISNNGKTKKRFDFVVKTESMIYGVEVNYYNKGGSKLNETARSYKELAKEAEGVDGFTFVWLTDGEGWQKAERNLEETFEVMEHIYNVNDLRAGVLAKVLK